MCVKLLGCCCGEPGGQRRAGRTAKKRARKYQEGSRRRASSEDEPPAGSMPLRLTMSGQHNTEQETKRKNELGTPQINFMQPRTMKLLNDIGELKGFHQNGLDEAQIQKNMSIHADILARLENPTGFA